MRRQMFLIVSRCILDRIEWVKLLTRLLFVKVFSESLLQYLSLNFSFMIQFWFVDGIVEGLSGIVLVPKCLTDLFVKFYDLGLNGLGFFVCCWQFVWNNWCLFERLKMWIAEICTLLISFFFRGLLISLHKLLTSRDCFCGFVWDIKI